MNTPNTNPRSSTRILDANPTVLWFTTKLPQTMPLHEQQEWHETLQEYLRTLGLVVHQEVGFSVAIPIGRDVLPTDRHEIANWAMDFAEEVELTLAHGRPACELLDFCEEVIHRSRREETDGLSPVGIFMVLQVVTRALLDWRDQIDALSKTH